MTSPASASVGGQGITNERRHILMPGSELKGRYCTARAHAFRDHLRTNSISLLWPGDRLATITRRARRAGPPTLDSICPVPMTPVSLACVPGGEFGEVAAKTPQTAPGASLCRLPSPAVTKSMALLSCGRAVCQVP